MERAVQIARHRSACLSDPVNEDHDLPASRFGISCFLSLPLRMAGIRISAISSYLFD
jgi:hypothetical protein